MPSQIAHPIRLVRAADAPRIAELYAPYVIDRPTSFEYVAPDAAEIARRIDKTLPQWPWLVWADGDGVQGYAYASAHSDRAGYQWSVGVSVYVATDLQRGGVGRALYTRLFEILRRQGFYNAYAGITLPNDASIGLHRAMGFDTVAVFRNVGFKLGAWHDVATLGMALLQPNATQAPALPLPFSGLLAAGELGDLQMR